VSDKVGNRGASSGKVVEGRFTVVEVSVALGRLVEGSGRVSGVTVVSGDVVAGAFWTVVVGDSVEGDASTSVDWVVGKVVSTGKASLVVVVELVEEVDDVSLDSGNRVLFVFGASVVVVVVVASCVVVGLKVVVV
jgi:hypothetical protein